MTTEFDFSKSENIKSLSHSKGDLIYKENFIPFTSKTINDEKENKICDLQYFIGFKINCKMKFEIIFPSLSQQAS